MNGFEQIGEFSLGSKGGGSRESIAEEQAKREKETQGFDSLLDTLQENHCDRLASYLSGLSLDQRKKLDSGLNMEGHGVVDLSWIPPEQQNEVVGVLSEIIQAQDGVAVRNASKRLSEFLE